MSIRKFQYFMDCFETMLQISDDIVDVFCTDGQTYSAWCDNSSRSSLIHLRMSGGCRMDDQRFTSATLASSENSSRDSGWPPVLSPVRPLLRK